MVPTKQSRQIYTDTIVTITKYIMFFMRRILQINSHRTGVRVSSRKETGLYCHEMSSRPICNDCSRLSLLCLLCIFQLTSHSPHDLGYFINKKRGISRSHSDLGTLQKLLVQLRQIIHVIIICTGETKFKAINVAVRVSSVECIDKVFNRRIWIWLISVA
jgi:hypothetical protein